MTLSAWFDPVTKRIDYHTGHEITPEEWKRWVWYDVTTLQGYEPGVHKYIKVRELTPELPHPPARGDE